MKSIIIVIIGVVVIISCARKQGSYTWVSEYAGDSVIVERYLSRHSYVEGNVKYEFQISRKGDTVEIIYTYYDRNGNDSVQIWKYPNQSDSTTIYMIYNDKNQLIRSWINTPFSGFIDTVFYVYDSGGNLVKEKVLREGYYTYDTLIYKNNHLYEKISFSSNSGLQHKEQFIYSDGNVLKKSLIKDNSGKILRIFEYEYSKGRLVESKQKLFANDTLNGELVFDKKYDYYTNDTVKTILIKKYNAREDVMLFYDEKKVLVKKKIKKWGSDTVYVEEYEYL